MDNLLFGLVLGLTAAGAVARADPVVWDVALWGERRAITEHVHELAELVAEKTNGEFVLNIDYGGLSRSTETLDGISIGAFEMAQFCAGYHPDKTPLLTVLELPLLGPATLEERVAASQAVYSHPAVAESLARWNALPLMPSPLPDYNLAGVGPPPTQIEDFAGMRVRALGGTAEALEAVGALPNRTIAPDALASLEAQLVDAIAFAPHAHLAFGTLESTDWWTTNLPAGSLECPIVVSADAYAELDEAHRAALDSSVEPSVAHYLATYEALSADWSERLAAADVQPITLSEATVTEFRERALPVRDRWVDHMTARGLPGREVYDAVQGALTDTDADPASE